VLRDLSEMGSRIYIDPYSRCLDGAVRSKTIRHTLSAMKLKLPVSNFPRDFDPDVLEMMDRKDCDPAELREDLRNIRAINRWLGAHRILGMEIVPWLQQKKQQGMTSCRILDLCTGSGDLPRVLVQEARTRALTVGIVATDINPFMLDVAQSNSKEYPEIEFRQADLLSLPFEDSSFDLVMCNLALHHFSVEQAVQALSQMWRITSGLLFINDLRRMKALTWLARYFIPLFSANPMTRFDAHLSTKRAFTPEEMLRLAFHARIPNPQVRRYFFGRQVLVAEKNGLNA
jgi:ubiquinone/menaquinone biosynthesis C-methylase UbiE